MKIKMAKLFMSKNPNMSEINNKFKVLDKDGNGMIASSDLISVLKSQGYSSNDPLITEIKEKYRDSQVQ